MSPSVFAMRRPITTLMAVLALVSAGALAFEQMQVDIFPSLNVPKIYVYLDYIGMTPDQMEGFIVNQLELYFQYVDGIKDIKSRNIQQVSLVELEFVDGTDIGQAMAQVVAMSERAMSWMPPGTLPPFIMRMDAGSIPVGYLVLESEEASLGQLGDWANNLVRPQVQKLVPGTVAISPFGPNMRSIVIRVDPNRMRAYNLTPVEVVTALRNGNVVAPGGNVYIKDSMRFAWNNATVVDPQRLGDIPMKLGHNVYLRDVATIVDDIDLTYGYALYNGKKACHLPVIKKDTGSALEVAEKTRDSIEQFRNVIPRKYRDKVNISFRFDETPTVLHAVESVATEGAIGAALTGFMILIFLRDPRSVIVVVANIPLALTGSLVGLWVTGNTINIMSLGGMALAIGILVDEATVTIENTHVQMEKTSNLATAVLAAAKETAVPRLLALFCILSVFIPAFVMQNPLRALFLPLTLGVAFAMISSYVLSSTLVPILSVYLLKHKEQGQKQGGFLKRMTRGYSKMVQRFVAARWVVVPTYLVICAVILAFVGAEIGTELFPSVDQGVFVLRFRPPPGSHYELTRAMAVKCLEVIEQEAGVDNMKVSLGFAGQVAINFGIDNMVLFMRGPDDGQLRVALRDDTDIKLDEFRERLRQVLPEKVVPWLADRLQTGGLSKDKALKEAMKCTFGFEPGDIVTKVMSFGSEMPIAVRFVGTDLADVRNYAESVKSKMERIPYLRDVQFKQTLDYPTVEVEIDREKANLAYATIEDVFKAIVMATNSTRFTDLNFWIDKTTGFSYLVEMYVPPKQMTTTEDLGAIPVDTVNPVVNLMIRDVADVHPGKRAGEYDRDMSQRFLTVMANVEGEDIGRAAKQVQQAIDAAGEAPEGVRIETQGQLPPMEKMFKALGVGLAVAVFVILVLLTAYFQSSRLAMIAVSAVPGVLAGIGVILLSTGTTLNIESFMGSIMCIGVSVSNSVMLVTFMNEHWQKGKSSITSAIQGAGERLRPILMTACAMTIGMVPMAMGLEKGSQMEAPLGRAVIGGLIMSTFATLLVVPSIFAVVIGASEAHSPSLDPQDPESSQFDEQFNAQELPEGSGDEKQ